MWKELQIRRYLWEVSRELPGNRKQKKTVLSRVENSVREFAFEQPNADHAAIVKWFGSPEKIAESFVLEMDAADLVWGMKIRYKILLIVGATAALCALVRFCVLATAYHKYVDNVTGYAVVEVIEVERQEMNEGGY